MTVLQRFSLPVVAVILGFLFISCLPAPAQYYYRPYYGGHYYRPYYGPHYHPHARYYHGYSGYYNSKQTVVVYR